jgi:hypothetical protein
MNGVGSRKSPQSFILMKNISLRKCACQINPNYNPHENGDIVMVGSLCEKSPLYPMDPAVPS